MSSVREQLRESGRALASVFSNPGLRRLELAFAGLHRIDRTAVTGHQDVQEMAETAMTKRPAMREM